MTMFKFYKIVLPSKAPVFILSEYYTETGWIVTDFVSRDGTVSGELEE